MKAIVNVFLDDNVCGSEMSNIMAVYTKNGITYNIYYKVKTIRKQKTTEAFDSTLFVAGFQRKRIYNIGLDLLTAAKTRLGANDLKYDAVITGYTHRGEWFCDEVPGHEAEEVRYAWKAKEAYEDGARNVNNKLWKKNSEN